ncbi:hypothetical protein [Streptomyces adustus]|uniref:hypothetical protein n=1 Tax=Streptomyces adustus TaxID=1609272 RepID=UPI003717AB38
MHMPRWYDWIILGLALLQALALVPISRRLRGSDPDERAKGRLDLIDAAGSLLLFGGMFLGSRVSGSWLWLSLVGFVLMGIGYSMKGIHLLRARRRPAA